MTRACGALCSPLLLASRNEKISRGQLIADNGTASQLVVESHQPPAESQWRRANGGKQCDPRPATSGRERGTAARLTTYRVAPFAQPRAMALNTGVLRRGALLTVRTRRNAIGLLRPEVVRTKPRKAQTAFTVMTPNMRQAPIHSNSRAWNETRTKIS